MFEKATFGGGEQDSISELKLSQDQLAFHHFTNRHLSNMPCLDSRDDEL